MPTIFLSYKKEDEPIAIALKAELTKLNYVALTDPDKSDGGGNWQSDMMNALKNADGIIAVFTDNTHLSQFVPGEIGMARAFKDVLAKNMFIIPLIISIPIPFFIQDLNSIIINSSSADNIKDAAQRIDQSIQNISARKKKYPKIFISHRHKDEKIVQALLSLLESIFLIKAADIRCTSVHPYKLPIGSKTSDRLKEELAHAEIVLGVIGPDTSDSHYVLFELGASWGLDKPTFPLLINGANPDNIPGPLHERHCITLSDHENCWQLVDELKRIISLKQQEDLKSRISREITNLVKIADAEG